MTLRAEYIKHDRIDFVKWDQAIVHSRLPTVFAQSYFLNATSPGWDALIINDYESVFPLPWKRKFGILYLPQPYFTGQLGAFGKLSTEREQVFFEYIIKRYKLIDLEINASNEFKPACTEPKNTFVIEYVNGFDFNQNTKRNLSKATANGLKVERVSDDQIITLSEKILNPFLLNELKLPVREVGRLNGLLSNCMEADALITFKVTDAHAQTRAIGHFVFNRRYVVFLKGTNIDKSENSGSMHLLIAHAIEHFKNKCECFDFGGGSLHEGLAGFYKGLGGLKRDYHLLRINNLPGLIKFFKRRSGK